MYRFRCLGDSLWNVPLWARFRVAQKDSQPLVCGHCSDILTDRMADTLMPAGNAVIGQRVIRVDNRFRFDILMNESLQSLSIGALDNLRSNLIRGPVFDPDNCGFAHGSRPVSASALRRACSCYGGGHQNRIHRLRPARRIRQRVPPPRLPECGAA